ncbi:hypothetical protein BH09PAT1_BH09PAT1_7860 [soil metagenome]
MALIDIVPPAGDFGTLTIQRGDIGTVSDILAQGELLIELILESDYVYIS